MRLTTILLFTIMLLVTKSLFFLFNAKEILFFHTHTTDVKKVLIYEFYWIICVVDKDSQYQLFASWVILHAFASSADFFSKSTFS